MARKTPRIQSEKMKHRRETKLKLTEFWKDWLERVFWTLAQVVLAVLIKEVGNLDGAYIPAIAAGLAALKGFVARKVGDPDSAATLK